MTYNVVDSKGLAAVEVTRTVNVVAAPAAPAAVAAAGPTVATITVAAITEEPSVEVAGISEEPKIEVAGITNLPFTGQNSYLAILGSAMLAIGISMVTLLVLRRRKPNMFINLYSRFSFLKKN